MTTLPLPSLSTAALEALLWRRLTVRRRGLILRELRGRVRVQVDAAAVPAGLVSQVLRRAVRGGGG